MSSSALPYKRSPPTWLKVTAQEVTENICKLAKKGHTPSQIGVILRDSHGIPQVSSVTSSSTGKPSMCMVRAPSHLRA